MFRCSGRVVESNANISIKHKPNSRRMSINIYRLNGMLVIVQNRISASSSSAENGELRYFYDQQHNWEEFVCFYAYNGSLCCGSSLWFKPKFLSVVKSVVEKAVKKEARMVASLLRLHFHECFVQGCDGSVLLDNTPTFKGEKTVVPNNNSIRGFDVVDQIKSELEK